VSAIEPSKQPLAPALAPGQPLDRPGQALLFVLAAAVLGHVLAMSNGHQDDGAMRVLTVALSLAALGVVLPRIPALARLGDAPVLVVLGLALIWQFGMLIHNSPGIYLQPRTPVQLLQFRMGLAAAAVLAGAGLSKEAFLGRWRMPLLLLVHFLLGCWLISASPNPVIDVDMMQREAVKALLHGQNPFTMSFPNIYGSTAFFGDKIADANRINLGFPYPPLSLLYAVPGQALFGDYRYGQLAAMTGAAALMAYARPGRIGPAVAALFLFTPRVFFVLEQGWTDPFLVLMLAATVFAACRSPGWVPYLFGLFIALKQYAPLAAALSWILVRPFRWAEFGRSALKAAAVAALVTLPFAVLDLKAFCNTQFAAHLGTPFRPDALTYVAWFGSQEQRVSGLGSMMVVLAVGLASWRASRTPAGFASALVLLYIAFFAFGAHAFCNHYYFIIGALCITAAAMKLAPEPNEPSNVDPVLALWKRWTKKPG
jgi:hypothetical protein